MRKPCTVCAGKTSRTGKACHACGKIMPPTPKLPGRKSLPKGQHRAKRAAKLTPPVSNPHEFRRAH